MVDRAVVPKGAPCSVGWLPPFAAGGLLCSYLGLPVLPFDAIEAIVGATLGFGIGEWLA